MANVNNKKGILDANVNILSTGYDAESIDFRRNGGKVAAYYYGEWTTPGPSYRLSPWTAIQPYSDRLPVISKKIADGIYGLPADDADSVQWEQQTAKSAGIDIFIHNIYWFDPDGGTNYRNITQPSLSLHAVCSVGMTFALQYSNHGTSPIDNLTKYRAFLTYVIGYWSYSNHWKINGKPVFYIFDAGSFQTMCQTVYGLGNTNAATQAGLNEIRSMAIAAGYPGAFIVSQSGVDTPFSVGNKAGTVGALEARGYDAETVYNKFSTYTNRWQRPGGDVGADTPYPTTLTRFAELIEVYRNSDDWITNQSGSTIPHFIPATCGWDQRPWKEAAGYGLPAINSFDNCAASPSEFLEHLRKQRAFAIAGARNISGVPPVVNIYAWNEYGEGGFLCPSRRYGWELLNKVTTVFGI